MKNEKDISCLLKRHDKYYFLKDQELQHNFQEFIEDDILMILIKSNNFYEYNTDYTYFRIYFVFA